MTAMSSPSQTLPSPAPATEPDLLSLRAELDRLDDTLHDTLMRRAEVVLQVASLRVKGSVPLRPGREAAIIRRLLARHSGAMPGRGIVRIWRELLATTTAQQRSLLVAVCQAEGDAPAAAWWTTLLHVGGPRIHVVGRLPFWTPRPEGSPKVQALLVSAAAPDPSGRDRSLLGLELPLKVSRAQLDTAVAAAGFQAGTTILRHDSGAPAAHALVDVDGFVGDDDPRLATLQPVLRPPVVLGVYAEPLSGED